MPFSLLDFELLYRSHVSRDLFLFTSYQKCNAELHLSYKASLLCWKYHVYGAGYVMKISKCISLQIMHYGKSVLRSYNSIVQGTTQKYAFVIQLSAL